MRVKFFESIFSEQWVNVRDESDGSFWHGFCIGIIKEAGDCFYFVRPEYNLDLFHLIPVMHGLLTLSEAPPEALEEKPALPPAEPEISSLYHLTAPLTRCYECGQTQGIHFHHVIPKSKGGRRTIPLCEPCHGVVHSQDFTDHSRLTREGVAKARAKGVQIGRKTNPKKPEILALRKNGLTYREIGEQLGIHPSTVKSIVYRTNKSSKK